MKKDLKVLITGAGGMFGTDLGTVLNPDFEVVGIEKRPVTHLTVPYDICDLTQARKTRDVILSQSPNIVFHTAAMTDVDACEERHEEALEHNVEATKNVVAACNELDVPVIFFSTDYIFDGTKNGEYLETDKPQPINFYGNAKLQAEQFILAQAKRAIIFRITWLFGVWGRCFPKAILRQAADVKVLNVVNDQIGRPTYSWDLAEAMRLLLIEKKDILLAPGREVFHLGNSGTVNWADFARFILKESGLTAALVKNIPSTELKRPAPRPLNSVLSLEKAHKVLGVQLRSWEDATREFLPRLKKELSEQEAKVKAQSAEKENTAT